MYILIFEIKFIFIFHLSINIYKIFFFFCLFRSFLLLLNYFLDVFEMTVYNLFVYEIKLIFEYVFSFDILLWEEFFLLIQFQYFRLLNKK